MLRFTKMDDLNTSIHVEDDVVKSDVAAGMVRQYVEYCKQLSPHQVVHVYIAPTVILRWEQMLQVYTSIRSFHLKVKVVDNVILYLNDKTTVKWFQCLTGLFSSSVKITIKQDP